HQLGFDRLAVDFHGELLDLRPFRNGKQKRAFNALRVRIVKLLFDGRVRELVFDPHFSLVPGDLQGAELVNTRGRDWPRPRPRSRSGAWQWPRWRDDSVGRQLMFPMRFIHDDQTGGPPGVDRGQEEEERTNPAFHVELDRKRRKML